MVLVSLEKYPEVPLLGWFHDGLGTSQMFRKKYLLAEGFSTRSTEVPIVFLGSHSPDTILWSLLFNEAFIVFGAIVVAVLLYPASYRSSLLSGLESWLRLSY
jgi:hypothetical protein